MEASTELILIYSTFPNKGEAKQAAAQLLENNLIACANIIDGMTSVYKWQDKVAQDQEALVIFKTSRALFSRVEEAIKSMHSYTTPAILSLGVDQASEEFKKWLLDGLS